MFQVEPWEAAIALLGRRIERNGKTGIITEVEAYLGPEDPASHAYRRTKRTRILWGKPGIVYTFSLHGRVCTNVVAHLPGRAGCVLIRSADVASGPGKFSEYFGITMRENGKEFMEIFKVGEKIRGTVLVSPRINVPRAREAYLRFFLKGYPVSGRKRGISLEEWRHRFKELVISKLGDGVGGRN